MPTTFEPIIAGGADPFGGIAAQRYQWAGFSNRVDEANMARAAQAQEQQNRWLATLAQMQRSDAAQQDAGVQSAYQFQVGRADKAASDSEHRREFDVGAEIQREAEKEKNKYLRWHYDIADKEKNKNLEAIKNFAEFMAPDVKDIGRKYDDAMTEYQKQMQSFETARSAIEKTIPPSVTYDARAKEFRPRIQGVAPPPEVLAKVNEANQELSKVRAAFDSAQLDFKTHATAFDTLRKQASANNLQVGKRGGKYVVFSPLHNTTFGDAAGASEPMQPLPSTVPEGWFPGAVHDARNPVPVESAATPPDGSGWAGFGTSTLSSIASPAAPGMNPMTPEIAKSLLAEARGNKDLARQLARERGYAF